MSLFLLLAALLQLLVLQVHARKSYFIYNPRHPEVRLRQTTTDLLPTCNSLFNSIKNTCEAVEGVDKLDTQYGAYCEGIGYRWYTQNPSLIDTLAFNPANGLSSGIGGSPTIDWVLLNVTFTSPNGGWGGTNVARCKPRAKDEPELSCSTPSDLDPEQKHLGAPVLYCDEVEGTGEDRSFGP
ncbi:hypothetical protein B0T14DRAFT_495515 [Immersiella caudata]|uniref:Uncharacterized protein n=1 Tax=Immersiella caudata TaxID=314043 RepID=A0AA39WYW3_9PEZI|nr:hypothetical protein B0T14DRAFT_495515 [Immersiella caudata]